MLGNFLSAGTPLVGESPELNVNVGFDPAGGFADVVIVAANDVVLFSPLAGHDISIQSPLDLSVAIARPPKLAARFCGLGAMTPGGTINIAPGGYAVTGQEIILATWMAGGSQQGVLSAIADNASPGIFVSSSNPLDSGGFYFLILRAA